jgi:PIN domain nuclease of toxin-antitoxin system
MTSVSDRIFVSTAGAPGITLITRDKNIVPYGKKRLLKTIQA